MSTTLDVWYYRDDDNASAVRPESVRTPSELDLILDYVLVHDQPHPPVLVVRERPRILEGRFPDHQIKIDVSRDAQLGAILCQGPPDFAPDAVLDDPEGGTWVTRSDVVDADAPPLYIDKATLTEFPADSVIPLAQWRKALGELLATGRRPTCVDWQDSDVF